MPLDKMQKRPYSLEEYNPAWVDQFEEIKKILLDIFGDKALAIEHVGSTAVPGMKAKPLIDVLVIVEKMESFQAERERMASHGYKNQDNYIGPDTILFYKEEDARKTVNIHVCVEHSPKTEQFIPVRDYLRSHPEEVKKYVELKERLAQEEEELLAQKSWLKRKAERHESDELMNCHQMNVTEV